MNFSSRERAFYLQMLLGILLCIFLSGLFYVITFRRPSVLGLDVYGKANATRTALALTSRALYGPFPTATGPTPTASKTPTITPTATVTPSITPTATPIRYFIDTFTPRAPSSHPSTAGVPVLTSTSAPNVPPTQPPPQATQPAPLPTQPRPQPTQPPPQSTQPSAQSTKKACVNPQGHPIPCH